MTLHATCSLCHVCIQANRSRLFNSKAHLFEMPDAASAHFNTSQLALAGSVGKLSSLVPNVPSVNRDVPLLSSQPRAVHGSFTPYPHQLQVPMVHSFSRITSGGASRQHSHQRLSFRTSVQSQRYQLARDMLAVELGPWRWQRAVAVADAASPCVEAAQPPGRDLRPLLSHVLLLFRLHATVECQQSWHSG